MKQKITSPSYGEPVGTQFWGNYREYRLNLAAIKSIDDIVEIFKALNITIMFYEGTNITSVQELIVKNNPHLFKEIKK